TYPPAVASTKRKGRVTVYASWNGDTRVAHWQILAGSSPSSLHRVGRPRLKTGFETKITVKTSARLVAAQARDAGGHVLATSPVVPARYAPRRHGYYLSSSGGNVYDFGVSFEGSLTSTGRKPAAPLTGIAPPPGGRGYYLPSSAGNVYNFDAPFEGSLTKSNIKPPTPVVGLAPYQASGYYLATSGGNIYNFGKAPFHGSPASSGT